MKSHRAPRPSPEGTAKLAATAKRLRNVRRASRKFLALWALEQDKKPASFARGSQEKRMADPMNHDWSQLYLGSVLDD